MYSSQAVVVHTFNPSAQGGRGRWISMSSRPVWFTEWVPGQPEIHRETLSRKTKTKKLKRIKLLWATCRVSGGCEPLFLCGSAPDLDFQVLGLFYLLRRDRHPCCCLSDFILCALVFCLHVCLYECHIHILELQTVVRRQVGAGNQTQVL